MVLSCCGLKQEEANSVTAKEPFVPGTERWELISPAGGVHRDKWGWGGVREAPTP